MEILTTNIKLPIFITDKNIYLTKKRNLSLSNQSSINTTISPNDKFEPSELFLDNTNNFVNLKITLMKVKLLKSQ